MRKRGFTLIEVAIALAIFVVGALAVIRIFPPAFNVVQNSGYSNVATRLSDSILAQMKGDGSTPEAVFDIDDTGNFPVEASWQDQAGAVVGTATKNYSLPQGSTPQAYDASALNHYRFIRGEKQEIQVVRDAVTGEPLSTYVLTNFPYDLNTGVRLYIEIPIRGVTINTEGRLDFSDSMYTDPVTGERDSFSDGGNRQRPLSTIKFHTQEGAVALVQGRSIIDNGTNAIDTGTRYYVSYQWRSAGSDRVNVVTDEPMSLPNNGLWPPTVPDENYVMRVLQGAINGDGGTPARQVIAGTVNVIFRFTLGGIDPATTNAMSYFPNTFPNPEDSSSYAAADNADRGYVPIYLSTGSLPFTPKTPVYADYLVPDWRVIFDKSIVDKSGFVFLPVDLLKKNTPVLGLKVDAYHENQPNLLTPTVVSEKNGKIDYGAGEYRARVRTAYQGMDGWAKQISTTAQSYLSYVNTSGLTNVPGYRIQYDGANAPTFNVEKYFLPREPWREYLWDTTNGILYFHASEAGKTVMVSFTVAGNNTPFKSQLLTISKNITDIPTPLANVDFAPTGKVAALQLRDGNGDPVVADTILSVRGAGVMARTAWLNGDKYEQSVATGYRTANAQ